MSSRHFIFLNSRICFLCSSSLLACFLSSRNKFFLTLAAALWRKCRERLLNFQQVISKLTKQARDARKDNKSRLGRMKYELRCDFVPAEKRMLTSVPICAAVRGRKYKDASTCFRRRWPRSYPILLRVRCEKKLARPKFVRGVFKLLFENFLLPKLEAGWVKGSLICKLERL